MSRTHPKFNILRSGIFPKKTSKTTTAVWKWYQAAVRELVDVELVASCEGGQLERRGARARPSLEILKSWEGKGNNSGNIGIFNIWDGGHFLVKIRWSHHRWRRMWYWLIYSNLMEVMFMPGLCVSYDTLPETNSSQMKIDSWKTILSFSDGPFSGAMLVSGSVVHRRSLIIVDHWWSL